MKNKRRILALLMALCMVAGMLPLSVNAAECEHHLEHTPECGYAAAQPCGHTAHTEACYSVTCSHVHNAESCGYDAATGEGCAHVHGDCDSSVLTCPHEAGVHEGCGYTAGSDCLYSCPTCAQAAYEAELAKCSRESGCPSAVHHADCARDIADKEAAELAKCDGGEQCPATLHKENCAQAAYEAELTKCSRESDCPSAVHHADCAKDIADKEAAELAKCDGSEQCPATLHRENCAKAAYEAELTKCSGGEDCPSTVHKDTCVKYVWTCDQTEDCKAADHAETCPVAVNLKLFAEMVAKLPAPDQVDPGNLEQIQALDAEIRAIIAFAEEKGLYTREEVTTLPAIAALLEAMYPTVPTLVIGNIELDFAWYDTNPDAGTFTISTVGQLAAFAKMTQGNVTADDGTLLAAKNSFSGKTIMLGDNITFAADQYWYYNDGAAENLVDFRIPASFTGSFDGSGKTISGLKFYNTDHRNVYTYMYLFETISANSSVKDLTLNTVTADINGYDYFGFIARTLNGTATNCHVKNVTATVAVSTNGKGYIASSGAMFGSVSGATIGNCTAENVKITCFGEDTTDSVGALIGAASGTTEKPTTITDCSVTNVTFDCTQKTKRLGGFIGNVNNTSFNNCTATSVKFYIDNYYQNVGGFAGTAGTNSTFTNCNVVGVTLDCDTGDQYGDYYANIPGTTGGFVSSTSGTGLEFNNCSVTGLDMDLEIDDAGYSANSGGFIGSQGAASITFSDCSVSGDITTSGENTKHSFGGFVGNSQNKENATISGCTADVDVTTFAAAGGFVGKGSGGTFTDCESNGTVTSTDGVAGGLAGYIPSGSTITFNNCAPSSQVSGEVTNPIANAQDREYTFSNGTISTAPAVCSGTVHGYEIGFASIQEALDEGVESITLLANRSEDLSLSHNLALNLGSFTLNSTITIPQGTFTVPENHEDTKLDSDIQGIKVTVNGTSTGNNILLGEPELDHHAFLGWCSSETDTPNYEDLKATGGWKAEPGFTYHAHWKHSSYEKLDPEQLHLTFRMTYGQASSEEKRVTFQPSDASGDHAITAFDQGQYFTVRKENLTVYLTPKAEAVSKLGVNAYGYEDVIHVTVEDGSVHTIHATLIVTQAESAITPQPSEGSATVTGVYGDTITLAVKVAARSKVRTLGADQMVFLYNGQQLAEPVPVTYQADGAGTAKIIYDTAGGMLSVGTSTVDVQYSGGSNLMPSAGTITVILTAREVAGGEIYTAPDGTTVTGPATFDQDGIHVSAGGKITVGGVEYEVTKGTVTLEEGILTIPSGSAVTDGANTIAGAATVNPSSATQTYPAGSTAVAGGTAVAVTTGSVTREADGSLTIPSGATVIINGQTITGPAAVGADGSVTVQTGGKIAGDGKEYTVTAGPVAVDNGSILIPEGSQVSDGKNTIAGPAAVDPSGTAQTYPAGSTVVVGDTTVAVTGGTVTETGDGTLNIPADATVTVDGVTVTGPASVDTDGTVTVGSGGKVNVDGKDYTVTTGPVTVQDGTVTVPAGSTVTDENGAAHTGPKKIDGQGVHTVIPQGGATTAGDKDITATQGELLKKEDGSVEIPDGSTAQVGGQTITGPAHVGADGSVTVDQGGSVGTGSTAVEVTQGSVNVRDDGTVEVLPGSKVETGDKTVTGPADIAKDGQITVEAGGSVTTGGNTVNVTTGTATVRKDGTVDIPAGSTAIVNGQRVTGPATVNKDGSVTIGSGGKVTVNGETYTVTSGPATLNKDGSLSVPAGSTVTDGKGNPIAGPKLINGEGVHTIYIILSGAGQTVTRGSDATFSSSADIGKFLQVEVDGAAVARSSYTLTEGSTVITLKASYLNGLSLGTHTLRIVSNDGFASTVFTLKAAGYYGSEVWYDSDSPKTGDTTNTGVWYALALIGLLGLTMSVAGKKYLIKRG